MSPLSTQVPGACSPERTLDTLPCQRVRLYQPRQGYRFSIDALLLAGHALRERIGRFLDAGTGCGVIACAVADRQRDSSGVAVEVQPSLGALAADNVALNGLGDRVSTCIGDLRFLSDETLGTFDTVLMNPPYFPARQGQQSPTRERAVARHQLHGSLAALVSCVGKLLRSEGRLEMVLPTAQLADGLRACVGAGLGDIELTLLRPRSSAPSHLALITARAGAASWPKVEAVWVVHDHDHVYTEKVWDLLRGPQGRDDTSGPKA